MSNITLESINNWKMVNDEYHRGEYPYMPQEERKLLNELTEIHPKLRSEEQKLMYSALLKKLKRELAVYIDW